MKYLLSFNQLNEEIGYKDLSISDLDDTFSGYTYLYSKDPINFENIKKSNTITTELSNKPLANDDIGNYVYLIKTKYPLEVRKDGIDYLTKAMNHNPLPNLEVEEEQDYSGYIQKGWISSETRAYVKTSDITTFKLIGGFKMFDKDVPNKKEIKLSEETDSFLSSYMSGRILHNKLTPNIEKELSQFKLNKPIKLYKGIEDIQLFHHTPKDTDFEIKDELPFTYPFFSSWSTNFLIAKRFIDESPSTTPFVIEYTAEPNDILVDTRLLPTQYFISDQREVILKKDRTFNIKIIWKGNI